MESGTPPRGPNSRATIPPDGRDKKSPPKRGLHDHEDVIAQSVPRVEGFALKMNTFVKAHFSRFTVDKLTKNIR